jgi:hypothetical protein
VNKKDKIIIRRTWVLKASLFTNYIIPFGLFRGRKNLEDTPIILLIIMAPKNPSL